MIISFSQLLSWIYDAVDTENESETFEPKGGKEAIDFKEVKRVDHILASLQRKVTCNFFVLMLIYYIVWSIFRFLVSDVIAFWYTCLSSSFMYRIYIGFQVLMELVKLCGNELVIHNSKCSFLMKKFSSPSLYL